MSPASPPYPRQTMHNFQSKDGKVSISVTNGYEQYISTTFNLETYFLWSPISVDKNNHYFKIFQVEDDKRSVMIVELDYHSGSWYYGRPMTLSIQDAREYWKSQQIASNGRIYSQLFLSQD